MDVCLGGVLSFEVARQLKASGHEVSLLILIDTPGPGACAGQSSELSHGVPCSSQSKSSSVDFATVASLLERISDKMRGNLEQGNASNPGERLQKLLETAVARYRPGSYDGKVVLIMASELPPGWIVKEHFLPMWQTLVPNSLHTHMVEGLHGELVRGSAVHKVAESISSHLDDPAQVLSST